MIDKSDNNVTDTLNIAAEPEPTKPAEPPRAKGAGFALFIAFLALFYRVSCPVFHGCRDCCRL